MATIKRAGNRIITKVVNGQRRVSCSCCETGCCMYDSIQIVGGDGNFFGEPFIVEPSIPTEYLPSTVMLNGQNLSRSGMSYGDTTNGIRIEGDRWAKYINEIRSTQRCLIAGGVTDQFPDVLTYENESKTYVMNRVSLCVWLTNGYDPQSPDPNEGALAYNYPFGVATFPAPAWGFEDGAGLSFDFRGDLSTPIGSYVLGSVS